MKQRTAERQRKTGETDISLRLGLDAAAPPDISTGIAFFDHMLHLMAAHGLIQLEVRATGDLEVDWHHTVEDIGLVLGDALSDALGDRKGIHRYGHAVTPMDESLATVTVDLSNRPYLVYNVPVGAGGGCPFDPILAKEFFRAFSNRAGMNLHINVAYGENDHHILEAVFKACGRALSQACAFDARITGVRSTKGRL